MRYLRRILGKSWPKTITSSDGCVLLMGGSEAQQRCLSYRAVLVIIVSQNSSGVRKGAVDALKEGSGALGKVQ